MNEPSPPACFPRWSLPLLALLVLCKVSIHLICHRLYGYHGDELYFMACGEHLDWGYVDHAPMIALIAAASRALFGDSLLALRFIPALTGGAIVGLAGLLALEFGGGLFAVLLSCLCVLMAPLFLLANGMLDIVTFDQLFWLVAACLMVLIVKRQNPRLWIPLGIVMGLGLMTKHSMLFFGFGLTVGLLLTEQRRQLLTPWPWIAASIAFIIFLPNILWQIRHEWPTLEFLLNINRYGMARISALEFTLGQVLFMHPFALPVWLGGVWFLFSKQGAPFRFLGWTYAAIFVLLAVLKSKIYYLGPVYPFLFAAGGCWVERVIPSRLVRGGIVTVLLAGGIALAPLSLPVLSLDGLKAYGQAFSVLIPNAQEGGQTIRDMLGWEEGAIVVAQVYQGLSPEEREKCAVIAPSYMDAGAVDFFGTRMGLPKAIAGHNSYHMWGPRNYTGEVVLTWSIPKERLEEVFDQVDLAATIPHLPDFPDEKDQPVYLCRKPKFTLTELWPKIKTYN